MNTTKLMLVAAWLGIGAVSHAQEATDTTREQRMGQALQSYRGGTRVDDPSAGPAERTENSIKRGARKTGHVIKHGAQTAGHAVGTGMRKTGDAIGRAGKKTQDASSTKP